MTCPAPATFDAFVRGGLPAGEGEALEAHVDACEACRIWLSELARRAPVAAVEEAAGGGELPAPGERVGRYTVVEELGAGAMGVVFLARDAELDRELAIKLVRPRPGARDAPEAALIQQRMVREGRTLARIDHPNVVRVFDVGSWRGAMFVAMERAPGLTLRAWLAAAPRQPAAIVDVLAQCAAGLAAAHAAGVIHRDFKPDNVVVDAAQRARVTDFGLAQTLLDADATPERAAATSLDDSDDPRLTRTRGAVGTPAYMAPEQHRGLATDGRADQFALCVTLVEALTGARPFTGADASELLAAIGTRAAPVALPGSLPARVRRAIERGLSAEPAARFPSMSALAEALAPRRRSRVAWLAGGGAAVAVVASLAGGLAARAPVDACAQAAASIDATWPAREARVGWAFARSGLGFAPAAWRYARGAVADYTRRWAALRLEVCRAGEPGPRAAERRDASVRCLDRSALALDAVLDRWEHGAGEALAAAPQTATTLPPLDHCRAPELDTAPAAAWDRARLSSLEARLAAAQADIEVGRAREATRSLAALDGELATTPLHALRAEVLLARARADALLGEAAQARVHLIAALAAAETGRAGQVKAAAWIDLAELAVSARVSLGEAQDALRLAGAVLDALGRPAQLVGALAAARGKVASRAGDHAGAVAALRESLTGQPTMFSRWLRQLRLANALESTGDAEGALRELEALEREITATLGPSSTWLIGVHNSISDALDYLGRPREAIEHAKRALALNDAAFGVEHPNRLTILSSLAARYSNDQDFARALPLHEAVLRLELRRHGADHHEVALARIRLASTLTEMHQWTRVLSEAERALVVIVRDLGPDAPRTADVHSLLAGALGQLGRPREAVEHARRANAINERAASGPGFTAFSRLQLANELANAGLHDEADALARSARALPLSATGREGELRRTIDAWLVEHRGDVQRARAQR